MNFNTKKKAKIALWLCASMQTSHLVLTSAISKVSDYFTGSDILSIQMIPTMTSLAVIPFAFLSGALAQKISKKSIVLFALSCILVGGLLPILFHQRIALLMIFSLLVGVGVGMMSPTVSSIISDQFEGKERSMELGRQAAALSIGGMLMTFLGGWLANVQWFNAYWSYLAVIPILIIAFLYLPKTEPVKDGKSAARSGIRIGRQAVFICIISMAFGLAFNIFGTNISLFIMESGISNTIYAGAANVAMMLGGFISGLLFYKLTGILKQYTFVYVFLFCAGGYFLFALFENLILVYLICFVIGACNGLLLSHGNKTLSNILDKKALPIGMGLFISLNHVGLFLSPIVFSGFSDLLNQPVASFRFELGAVFAIIFAAMLSIYYRLHKSKK